MITDSEEQHYLAVKSFSGLCRGITSNHDGDFYYIGYLHSFLKKHERSCGNHDYYRVDIPEKDKNILKYYPGEKSLKAPFALYADFECLLKKEQSCQNNPEKSYTERKAKHEPSGYSLSLICSFDSTKNKHYVYRGEDCVKHFCKILKELGTEIFNYEEKEMMPLTDEEIKFYENQKQCHICEKGFFKNKKDKFKHIKVRDHCHYSGRFRGAAHSICNLRYNVPKKIPVIIHNRSTYDDHFIINQLPEEFEGQFKCLEENIKKYNFFSTY